MTVSAELGALRSTKASAVDWSAPVQSSDLVQWRTDLSTQYLPEQDWYQHSFIWQFGYDGKSVDFYNVRLYFSADDYFGEHLMKWVSVYDYYSGALVYDSGWTLEDINETTQFLFHNQVTPQYAVLRVVQRVKYADGTPLTSNAWWGSHFSMSAPSYSNYTVLPPDWYSTSTERYTTVVPEVTTVTVPDDFYSTIEGYMELPVEISEGVLTITQVVTQLIGNLRLWAIIFVSLLIIFAVWLLH